MFRNNPLPQDHFFKTSSPSELAFTLVTSVKVVIIIINNFLINEVLYYNYDQSKLTI